MSAEPAASIMAEVTARLEELAAFSTEFHREPGDTSTLRAQLVDVLRLLDAAEVLTRSQTWTDRDFP